jgi:hypothetical protein
MYSDARSDREHMTTSSEARRRAEVALAVALDESPHVTHPATRAAVHTFVDALAAEGLMPEAVVIALKDLLLRNPTMHRFEPEARAELRTALVSECITHYFGGHTLGDVPPPPTRPKLKIIRGGGVDGPRNSSDRTPDGRT